MGDGCPDSWSGKLDTPSGPNIINVDMIFILSFNAEHIFTSLKPLSFGRTVPYLVKNYITRLKEFLEILLYRGTEREIKRERERKKPRNKLKSELDGTVHFQKISRTENIPTENIL